VVSHEGPEYLCTLYTLTSNTSIADAISMSFRLVSLQKHSPGVVSANSLGLADGVFEPP